MSNKYDHENDVLLGEPLFDREILDNAPHHNHDCGLPHVDERCPRKVMVKLLRPNANDDLFSGYNAAATQAIHDHFRLPIELLPGQQILDLNDPVAWNALETYQAWMIGRRSSESTVATHGDVDAFTSSDASTAIMIAEHAVKATPAPNTVALDADYEALLESGGECQVTIVHQDVLAALADAMGNAFHHTNDGPQCDDHDLFTDDDGVQRCVFCMMTQEEIDAYEAMMQAQAYEATYGSCECCGAFDDDIHDANCPRRPCTEEEDAAHEQRCDDPGRYDDDFDPDYPDDDDVVIMPPSEPEDGCDE